MIFRVGNLLSKTVSEVLEMSVTEFMGWIAYLNIIEKNHDRSKI